MNQAISSEIREVMEAPHYRPAVSIIMPFEFKMNAKAELLHRLKFAVDKAEKEIRQNYTDDLAEPVIHKLRNIIKDLHPGDDKKSIAIYVSPVFEKALYLDIPVEEKIIIDESFEIRDLVYAPKEIHKYLLLLLSGKSNKIFIGDANGLIKVRSNVPDNMAAYLNDAPERVTNFSDPSERKEANLKKFLHEIDGNLSSLLKTHNLPVIVMGAKKTLGYFKDITRNEKNILTYVHGNYEETTVAELKNILKSHVNDSKKIKIEDLRHQMEKAANAGKLATGIQNVWKQASQHKGSLLIVEKNFMYAAQNGSSSDIIDKATESNNQFSYIKDAVDDAIEKVLEYGGDVEFVDEGILNDHQHIALIQYY